MNDLVKIEGVYKKYYENYVIKNLNLKIPANRIIGLLGNNGIGKTTFLRLLANIIHADKGSITFFNEQGKSDGIESVAYLLEPANFYEWMKIKDAIEYYQDFFPDFDTKKAFKLFEEFKLSPEAMINKLSKGNKERVCFLLALSRNVKLYLLDEPMAGLDPLFKKNIKKTLLSNIPEGATVIMATHLLRDLEILFDQIIIMKENQVICANTEEIREKLHLSVEAYYMEVMENVENIEMGM